MILAELDLGQGYCLLQHMTNNLLLCLTAAPSGHFWNLWHLVVNPANFLSHQ